jgi:hypothetical protein
VDNTNSKKSRRFLQGAAVVLVSLAGAVGTANASASASPRVSNAGQAQPEFVIAPAEAAGAMQYSHESHASHASHSSHSSHVSSSD